MRMKAPLMPEFGVDRIKHTENKSYPGTQGYQRIHVRFAMSGLLPGVDKE